MEKFKFRSLYERFETKLSICAVKLCLTISLSRGDLQWGSFNCQNDDYMK